MASALQLQADASGLGDVDSWPHWDGWCSGCFERKDELHLSFEAAGTLSRINAGELKELILPGACGWGLDGSLSEQCSGGCQEGLSIPGSQQAIVPDFVQSFGQDVQQKSTDELTDRQGHDFLFCLICIVFVSETDPIIFQAKDAFIGDGHPMGISPYIVDHLLRSAKRGLGIDDPFFAIDGSEVVIQFLLISDLSEGSETLEPPLPESSFEPGEEFAPKKSGEDFDRQKELSAAVDPTLAIEAESSSRNEAVQMGVIDQGLSPGMKDGQDACLGMEIFLLFSQLQQALTGRVEEQIVAQFFIGPDQGMKLMGQGEDQMKMLHGQEFCLASFEPAFFDQTLAFGTMPIAAGVITHPQMPTAITLINMSPQSGRPAGSNGIEGFVLGQREGVGLAISPSIASEDLSYFDPGLHPNK